VATAYEKKQGEFSRIYQMALLYLYAPSSAFFSCPLAMTDGAARAIELHGNEDLKQKAFKNLTSRNPESFWTSGQWMTERTGGSDVSGTSTIAKKKEDGSYSLHGTKWFTSATTSQMALTLAKIEGEKGLSLFYLELKDNNIEVHRLKDKLGTDALPTAELTLNGTKATLMGLPNEGVKHIASVLNITRIYNSICALGHMRRSLDLAKSYASKRKAFGSYIADLPLHKKTLQDLETEFEKCFKLTFFVVGLLGKEENHKATDIEKKLLRALTPIAKLYTAKKAIMIASEVVECFGGAGYIENTGIPRLLRDAQVFSIWEGTTNVLAMDFLRVCEKEKALETISEHFKIKDLQSEKWQKPENARELVFAVAERVISSL
jgi:putative acyl-CoA dehydrogenase